MTKRDFVGMTREMGLPMIVMNKAGICRTVTQIFNSPKGDMVAYYKGRDTIKAGKCHQVKLSTFLQWTRKQMEFTVRLAGAPTTSPSDAWTFG